MLRGYETLGEIDAKLQTLREESAQLDRHIDTLVSTLQHLEEEQSDIIRRIAQVQWDAIASGDIDAEDFNAKLQSTIEHRKSSYAALQTDLAETQRRIEQTEKERRDAYRRLQEASQAVVAKESEIQAALENDTTYQALLRAVRDAKSRYDRMRQKSDESSAYYAQKAKPYEDDPLFTYLWRRRYGTSEYRAGVLTAYLDGKIAAWIDYRDYARIYRRLQAVPTYLKGQTDARRKEYDEALHRLQTYERTRAKEEGLDTLQNEEQKRRDTLDAIDDTLESLEEREATLTAQKERYLRGEDEEGRTIVALLQRYISTSDPMTLMRRALQTSSRQDDALVRRLDALQKEYDTTQRALQDARARYDEVRDRLSEFEALRRRFKRSRYDDIRSGFDTDAGQIGEVLGGLLGGLLQSDAVWDTLRRNHRTVSTGSWPDFGSGGLDPQGSPWSFPMPREGGDRFGFPDIGGGFCSRNPIDSDTFRTGGGF